MWKWSSGWSVPREASGRKRSTIAFASALQDRYGVKKVNNSASVGVGAIGSLSLPFSSSDDAMVKVASQTLTDDRFYDRFFSLIDRFLPETTEEPPAESPSHRSRQAAGRDAGPACPRVADARLRIALAGAWRSLGVVRFCGDDLEDRHALLRGPTTA